MMLSKKCLNAYWFSYLMGLEPLQKSFIYYFLLITIKLAFVSFVPLPIESTVYWPYGYSITFTAPRGIGVGNFSQISLPTSPTPIYLLRFWKVGRLFSVRLNNVMFETELQRNAQVISIALTQIYFKNKDKQKNPSLLTLFPKCLWHSEIV